MDKKKKKDESKIELAKGTALKMILNLASGFRIDFNITASKEKQAEAFKKCVEKKWLEVTHGGTRAAVTHAGKEAAGLILREVPMPKHLADLLGPGIRVNRG